MKFNLGYHIYSTEGILFNAGDIKQEEAAEVMKSNKYQIYLVTKRKKYFFDRCEQLADHNVSWFYYLDGNHDKQWLERKHEKEVLIKKSDVPGYTTYIERGDAYDIRNFDMISKVFAYRALTGDASPYGDQVPEWNTDLEIVYIGQSFGNMRNRLEKHEKIKEVALQVIEENSNEEILVLCFAVQCTDNVSAFVMASTNIDVLEESFNTMRKKAGKRVSAQQKVTLFEASLIKHFQPLYNTEYKVSFPGSGYTSYDQIYQTDFDYLSMGIAVPEDFNVRIYSRHANQPAFAHGGHFPLQTQHDKQSLFDFLYQQSKSS